MAYRKKSSLKLDIFHSLFLTYIKFFMNICGQIYFAKSLASEVFGSYALLISYVAIFDILTSFNFNDSYIQLKENKSSFLKILNLTFYLVIIKFFIGIIFFITFVLLFSPSNQLYLLIIILSKIINPFNKIYLTYLDKSISVSQTPKFILFSNFLGLGIGIILLNYNFGLLSIIIKEIFPHFFIFIIFLPKIVSGLLEQSFSLSKLIKKSKGIIVFSKDVYFSRAAELLYYKIPNIIVEHIYGTMILGYLHQIIYFLNALGRILHTINERLLYFFLSKFKNDSEKTKMLFNSSVVLTLTLSLPLSISFYFFSYEIIFFILGENWTNAHLILKYSSLYVVSINLFNILQSYFLSIREAIIITKVYILGSIIMFALIAFVYFLNLNTDYLGLLYSLPSSFIFLYLLITKNFLLEK